MEKRVVVIDDSQFMRVLLKNILLPRGYIVAGEAEDGAEGIAKIRELKPDIVFLDIVMPKVDGLKALKIVKAEMPEVKVIMCTALGQEEMVRRALELGADGYVVKPFKARRVIEELEKVIGR